MTRRHASFNSSLLALAFAALVAVPAGAEKVYCSEGDLDKIRRFEQHLFFNTNDDAAMQARVNRIEKRVFGQSMEGALNQRVARLQTAIGDQVKGVKVAEPVTVLQSEMAMHQKAISDSKQQQAALSTENRLPEGASQSAFNEDTSASADATGNDIQKAVDDRECSFQRAKVAVLAAKEEEVRSLMAEGVGLWRRKRGSEAIERFEQVIRLDSNNADAHYSMGIVFESQGDMQRALSSYRQASRLKPNKADYLEAIQAAKAKVARGQVAGAQKAEIKKIAVEALQAFQRRDYQTALGLYKAMDEKAPSQPLVKYNIGTIYLLMEQPEMAFDYYKAACKLNPKEERYVKACKKLEAVLFNKEAERRQAQFQARHTNPGTQAAGLPQMQQAPGVAFYTYAQQSNAAAGSPPLGSAGTPGSGYGQQMPGIMPQGQVPGMLSMPAQMVPGMVPGLDCPGCTKKGYGLKAGAPSLLQAGGGAGDPMNSYGIIGSNSGQGVVVTTIGIASKASRAGMMRGDIIRAVDGVVVNDAIQFNNILSRKPPGSALSVLIQRNQNMSQLTL